ncbi:hypothetical protein [Streptomyces sp. NBC_01373]|uniref:hypothetical protein n=1 Tax=Streptomyces sp. NBC_01373 TaxID=2903843 RepID=UPI0022557B79|nr:hypothetical protein [Streptomyces sp. NBC_01373]MCX4703083.1 hypothetical protein [Streptomyces sp. NBC_01373]
MTKAPNSQAETAVSSEVAAWRAAQKARTTGTTATASGRSAAAEAAIPFLPEGQGEVPWHRILDTAAGLTCGALTAGTGVGAAAAPAVCAGVGFYAGEIVSGAIKGD